MKLYKSYVEPKLIEAIQSVYSVKSTSRNGVRGYLVIGKI